MREILIPAALVLSLLPAATAAREVSIKELDQRTKLAQAELEQREAAVSAMTPEQQGAAMVAQVKNRTIVFYQSGHGVYAEYTSADGRVFMWYKRNKNVVYGAWGLKDFDGPKLCYKYFNSVNGVTGTFEPTECIPPRQALIGEHILDSRPGDPFGLATGKLPYSKTANDVPDWPEPVPVSPSAAPATPPATPAPPPPVPAAPGL